MSENFDAADAAIKKNLPKDAEAAIQSSIKVIKNAMAQATNQGKLELTKAAKRLGQLDQKLSKDGKVAEKDLKLAYSQAHQTLARHHFFHSVTNWAAGKAAVAGREMKSAANHMVHDVATVGGALDSDTAKLVVKANLLGDKLAKGIDQSAASVESFFKGMAHSLASQKNMGVWFYETVPSEKVSKFSDWATAVGYKLDQCKNPTEKTRFMKWAKRFIYDNEWSLSAKNNEWKESALSNAGKTVAKREKDFAPSKENCAHLQTLYDNVKARLMLNRKS